MLTSTYNFTFPHKVTEAGLILFEDAEIEGIATFTYSPGSPNSFNTAAGNWYPGDEPEIEITEIEVYGHADTQQATRGEYRRLPTSSPLWQPIVDWLMERQTELIDDATTPSVRPEPASFERDDWPDAVAAE